MTGLQVIRYQKPMWYNYLMRYQTNTLKLHRGSTCRLPPLVSSDNLLPINGMLIAVVMGVRNQLEGNKELFSAKEDVTYLSLCQDDLI